MKQILLGGIVGGLVFFIYLSIAWTVMPFHTMAFAPMDDSQPLMDSIAAHQLPSGLYSIPSITEHQTNPEATQARVMAGPVVAFMVYYAEGQPAMNPMMFVKGLLLALGGAFIATIMMKLALPGLNSYLHRVLIVTGFGVFAALIGPLTLGNWMMFPAGYVWAEVFDQIVGWTLAGLAIAAFIKKPAA
jgi:hypothetical protein